MSCYPSNGSGGADWRKPLDPDNTSAGSPYRMDFREAIGAGNLASATAVAESGIALSGNLAVGTWVESTTYPDTGTFTETPTDAHAVQVVMVAEATAIPGRRYGVTIVATDGDGYEHHRTGYITVAER